MKQSSPADLLQKEEGRIIPWVFHRSGELIKVLKKSWKKATTAAGVQVLDRLDSSSRLDVARSEVQHSPAGHPAAFPFSASRSNPVPLMCLRRQRIPPSTSTATL
jgi:hypothetical protein